MAAQGCAERPSTHVEVVLQTIEDARVAGAEDYAFEELQQAQTSYRLGLEELELQDERFVWWRSYSRANQMLELAHSQAKQAKTEALANLEETKSNAQMAMALARDQIEQAQSLLEQPVAPYSITQQFEKLQRALTGAEALLDNMETSMGSGDYIQVMTSAHAVESLALNIQQHILSVLSQSTSTKVQV